MSPAAVSSFPTGTTSICRVYKEISQGIGTILMNPSSSSTEEQELLVQQEFVRGWGCTSEENADSTSSNSNTVHIGIVEKKMETIGII